MATASGSNKEVQFTGTAQYTLTGSSIMQFDKNVPSIRFSTLLYYKLTTLTSSTDRYITDHEFDMIDYTVSGDHSIFLPSASLNRGRVVSLSKFRTSGNTVTISSSEGNIDGVGYLTSGGTIDFTSFASDGTNWWTIGTI